MKNLLGLSTLEFHFKKLDVYGYGGAEYAARTVSWDPLGGKTGTGGLVGYGATSNNNSGCSTEQLPATSTTNPSSGFDPGALSNCTADSRVVVEGTVGFWYKFYSGDRGKFQFGPQYSYVTRNSWSGTGGLTKGSDGISPHGIDNMVFLSFRYYLP